MSVKCLPGFEPFTGAMEQTGMPTREKDVNEKFRTLKVGTGKTSRSLS